METMSQAMHDYVDAKLRKAGEIIGDAQNSLPTPPEYRNFEWGRRTLEESRAALSAAWDVDAVARLLRSTAADLARLCGGPAEASINAALGLIDQAIGGETM